MFSKQNPIIFLLIFLFLLICPSQAMWWDDGDSNDCWDGADNWNTDVVPTLSDQVLINSGTSENCPVIDSDTDAVCDYLHVGHTSTACLNMTGGTLTADSVYGIRLGRYDGSDGTFNLSGGSVEFNDSAANFLIGSEGIGTLNMTGGNVDVTGHTYIPRYSTGDGGLNLDGGTFETADFSMRDSGGTGVVDINGGTLIIDGNVVSTINDYIDSNWITAYNGWGTLNVDYNNTNLGQTTVTANVSAMWWDNGDPNYRAWHRKLNWNTDYEPGKVDIVLINSGDVDTCPIINSGTEGICDYLHIGHNSTAELVMYGGTLKTHAPYGIRLGRYSGSEGTFNMHGGEVSFDDSNGKLWIGTEGKGTLNMTGGTITVPYYTDIPRYSSGEGALNIDGGKFETANFRMRVAGGTGTVDINEGELVIDGNVVSTINTYIDNGWITAYDGEGELSIDYNISHANQTTVKGILCVDVNGNDLGREYEGLGVESLGHNCRLLKDYNEPYQSDVLDYLFKPNFGASFQYLKVEVGAGSAGGAPSHAITKSEVDSPVERGVELWLMDEAVEREPNMVLDCVAMAFPYWLSGKFSQDTADYFTSFLDLAYSQYGLELDWLAATQAELYFVDATERAVLTDWIIDDLRPTLDNAGYTDLKLQAPEGKYANTWDFIDDCNTDPDVNEVLDAITNRYVVHRNNWPTEAQINVGKRMWSGEDQVGDGSWYFAKYMIRRMNEMYIRGKITNMALWIPVDSCVQDVLGFDVGAMQADTPWSNHYTVRPAIWGAAHYNQFARIGWKYIDSGCALISDYANYATLKSPDSNDWSMIICTDDEPVTMEVTLSGDLSTEKISVWRSSETSLFVQDSNITPVNNKFTISVPADALCSLTTTTGQQKGLAAASVPAEANFPIPYFDDFEDYNSGDTVKYLYDMQGTYEVKDCNGGRSGQCIEQIVPELGEYTWGGTRRNPPETMSIIPTKKTMWDYEINSDVFIADGGQVHLTAHKGKKQEFGGYSFELQHNGDWYILFDNVEDYNIVYNRGSIENFDANDWHNMRFRAVGDNLAAYLDGKRLCTVADAIRTKGQFAIGGSYDENQFDDLSLIPAGANWIVIDQNDPCTTWDSDWTYELTTNWTTEGSYSYYGDDCKYSDVNGAGASFTFYGKLGRIIATKTWDAGYMDIYLDDVFQTSIDCYASSSEYQEVVYETNELTIGYHTIDIEVAGQKNADSSNYTLYLEGFAYSSDEKEEFPQNLAQSATASASSQWSSSYSAAMTQDANYVSRWCSGSGDANGAWLEMDFGQNTTFRSTRLTQFSDRIQSYKIQYYDGSWKDAYSGGPLGACSVDVFPAVTGTKVRLYVSQVSSSLPSIYEFEVYSQAIQMPDINGMELHLAADSLGLADGDSVDNWIDLSGNDRDATQSTASKQPVFKSKIINGLPVIRFDGSDDYMTFDDINDIRTVFWVIKEDSDATTKRRCVLGHSSQYDFWRGYDAADSDPFWDGTYTASEVVNGTLEVNGTSTNGLNTAPPTTASIVYLQTTGNVQADQLTKDRTFDSRVWDGDIAEIIIYSDTLTSTEQQQVIDYLSEKYDITVN